MTIQEIEVQIAEIRARIDELEQSSDPADIAWVRSEIYALEQRLNKLKANLGIVTAVPVYQAPQRPVYDRAKREHKPKRDRKDIEKFVGQSVMGILAAVLIFIAMGVFGAMILPVLPMTVRMLLLYAASAVVTVFGLWRLIDKPSRMAMTITGIGVGGVYVSIILTRVLLFPASGGADIPMYAALAAWCMGVLWLSKKAGGPFEAIAHAGIAVATLFGLFYIDAVGMTDGPMLIMLAAFFGLSELISVLSFLKKGNRLQPAIFSTLACSIGFNLFCLDNVAWTEASNINPYLRIGGIGFMTAVYAVIILCSLRRRRGGFMAAAQDVVVFLSAYLSCGMLVRIDYGWAVGLICTALACVFIWARCYDETEWFVLPGLLTVLALGCFGETEAIPEFVSLLILIPVFVTAVKYRQKLTEAICIILMFFGGGFIGGGMAGSTVWLMTACAIIWAAVFEEQHDHMRAAAHAVSAVAVYDFLTSLCKVYLMEDAMAGIGLYDFRVLLPCAALFGLNYLAAKLSPHGREWVEDNTWLCVSTTVCHVFVMLRSLSIVDAYADPVLHMLSVILAVSVFLYGSMRLLKYRFGGLYVGAKFTLLCSVVLGSFSMPDCGISIAFFVLAAWAVIFGFANQFKSLRIFGLLLACVSVCKLVLSDLLYSSSGLKAGGFLICGLLCLGINYAYNRMASKYLTDESEDT